jgi:hypothetical protein
MLPLPLSSDSCDDPETLELSEVLGLGFYGGFLKVHVSPSSS